ncbi:hypothetical protein BD310DRAFT_73372 [Dichomitus squalens]|uniref:Uncharacterized protein n=1 Tax=Dichomitus squalens TaxID=114155 RepID=A0A4Q9PK99_9APHY|nr:hypothetical protein BD310DRAFT_73372 [Dichomitus squalens]
MPKFLQDSDENLNILCWNSGLLINKCLCIPFCLLTFDTTIMWSAGGCYVPCPSPSGTPSDTALTPPDLRTCLQIDTYVLVPISFPFPFRSPPGPIWLSERLPYLRWNVRFPISVPGATYITSILSVGIPSPPIGPPPPIRT